MDGTWLDHSRWPPAGRVLAAATIMPALLLAGWLPAGLVLLLFGAFRPLPVLLLGGALAVALCAYAVRLTRAREAPEATFWQVTAVAVIAAASGLFNGLFHSQQLLVRRDPGTYAQYAAWLARRGSLPIPYDTAAFGGADPALRFDSVGFYDYGGAVVPQFMPGAPMLYAPGHWLGGLDGLLVMPAVLGALAVLTVAGVVARLAGARWAPLAALAFAVALPILYTSRTTLSEIPSLILLFGGLALALDARARPRVAALAGLVFGLALLVRIDGLRDILPVLAYAGLLIAMRRAGGRAAVYAPMGPWLLGGLVVGAGIGFAAALLLARPYLSYLSGSVVPLLYICAAVLVMAAAGASLGPRIIAWFASRAGRAPRLASRVPGPAAGLVFLVMLGFAARPWLQTVHRVAVTPEDQLNAGFIEAVQQANGLPLDRSRLYYEDSLYWVFWYLGVPAVVLATFAAALLVHRMARGRGFAWVLPLAVVGWTTVTTLWLPAITPDHPFASRRLVPVVIPGLVVLAVWGGRWAAARARWAGYGPRARAVMSAIIGALLVVPAAITSIGTAFTHIEQGEAAQVERLCAALPRDASVLIVERVTSDRFPQVVRGMCGVPTASVRVVEGDVAPRADVERLIGRVRSTGRRPVLLAADRRQLAPYGTAEQVVSLRTRQDERSLVSPPDGTWSLNATVWMTTP
ncbi:hypothetical protein DQ384_25635 [Sphaerisporangium album]|uniref:Glycosyltransferase RgtA/B/C/D-like domain-containing protein n=1 Tax=Sphaerisporangium album TaxID=509200 RepID=A0A367FC00_9ACTN|nr:hypothetical protein [Sphaerisporangium album]RCG27903.1 hypothetical protein DQ384_25635 [Sphaerisporangium album]